MKTKIIPFDLETAKKIQAGEIEGKIVNHQMEEVRIFAFDVQNKKCIVGAVKRAFSEGEYIEQWDAEGRAFAPIIKESFLDLVIELTEETPKHKFKPFDKVLVRNSNSSIWVPRLYSYRRNGAHYAQDGIQYQQVIPYEGNEHLVGTTVNPIPREE